jgi:hypothetical protein
LSQYKTWDYGQDNLDDMDNALGTTWQTIRTDLADFKAYIRHLRSYVRESYDHDAATSFLRVIFGEEDNVADDLLAAEILFRDILQVRSTTLSLAESRRSIAMSKKSIEEGKRVKLGTSRLAGFALSHKHRQH